MAAFIPGGVFSVGSLTSHSMTLRDERLKVAKQHADKTQRELARDRMNLERKESQLVSAAYPKRLKRLILKMAECKRLAQKGDLTGARMVANQIARYRRISDRNLEASINIGTKAQTMVSDHKVNKGQVESIKGFTYANEFESFARTEAREQRYAWRIGAINHLETSMRESMDDAYKGQDAEQLESREVRVVSGGSDQEERVARANELELDTILNQAMGAKNKQQRVYLNIEEPKAFVLHVQSLHRPMQGATITLSEDVCVQLSSVDLLKRQIAQDTYAQSQLELVSPNNREGLGLKPFELGVINQRTGQFEPFPFNQQLGICGVKSGDTVHCRIIQQHGQEEADAQLQARINRINQNQ